MVKRRRRRRKDRQVHNEVAGLIVLALAILAGASLISTADVGKIGAFLARFQRTIAGQYALFIPFFLLLWGLRMIFFPNSALFARRAIGALLIIMCILTAVQISAVSGQDYSAAILFKGADANGGVLGAIGALGLLNGFGRVGGVIILISVASLGLFLLLNVTLKGMVQTMGLGAKKVAQAFARAISSFNSGLRELISPASESADKPQAEPVNIHDYQVEETQAAASAIPVPPAILVETIPDSPSQEVEPLIELEEQELYQLPPLSLLQKTIRLRDPQGRRELVSQADILEETLANFGIEAKVINVHRGPTITRFEIQPASGVKVSRIVNLADDLAMNLAATGVRIEAPIPGKSAIGLEVANKSKATVYLREVLETNEFLDNPSKLAVALGKDIAGATVIADLMEIPHLLIAGATGSGKSVCLNSLIISLLYKAKPSELKFLLIDPKVVELSVYNGLPHLLCPVITDPRQASQGLKNVVKEMEQRYHLFAQTGAKDIQRYNEQAEEIEERPLPFIIVIIDELADLMMISPTDVEDAIFRIAQKSRAAGIHLIVATQRPSVDVITGVIKANLTTRIAFAVSSQADSKTILDMSGAEKLLGRGDMLFSPFGSAKPQRLQSAFISDEEVEKVVAYILGQSLPMLRTDFLQPHPGDEEEEFQETDELLADAARMVVETGQASISMLQRRLRVGYTRAGRLIDDMERLSIVGGHEGSKARKILVTLTQLEEILETFVR